MGVRGLGAWEYHPFPRSDPLFRLGFPTSIPNPHMGWVSQAKNTKFSGTELVVMGMRHKKASLTEAEEKLEERIRNSCEGELGNPFWCGTHGFACPFHDDSEDHDEAET